MNKYLVKVYNKLNEKNHFVTDIVEALNKIEVYTILKDKIYYKDSERKHILGTCKKIEIVHEI